MCYTEYISYMHTVCEQMLPISQCSLLLLSCNLHCPVRCRNQCNACSDYPL